MGNDSRIRNQYINTLDFFFKLVGEHLDGGKAAKIDYPQLGPVETSALFEVFAVVVGSGVCKNGSSDHSLVTAAFPLS